MFLIKRSFIADHHISARKTRGNHLRFAPHNFACTKLARCLDERAITDDRMGSTVASALEHVTQVPAANYPIADQTRRMRETTGATLELTIEFVLERIERSRNEDELAEVVPYAAMLRKDGDKERARRAYAEKLDGLRASVASDNGKRPDQDLSPPLTYAVVRNHIEHAQSLEALEDAMSMIDAASHTEYREELREIAQARREGLTQ